MKRNLWNMTAATLGALALSMNGIRPAGAADSAFMAAGTVPPDNYNQAIAGLTGRYIGLDPVTTGDITKLTKTISSLNLGDWQTVLEENRPYLALNIENKMFPSTVTSGGSGANKQDNIYYSLALTGSTSLTSFNVGSHGSGDTANTPSVAVPAADLTNTSLTATIYANNGTSDLDMVEGDYSMSILFTVAAQ